MNEITSGLLWLLVLLLGNAFFVAAEFALISARRAQIEPRAEAGSKPAKLTLRAMEKVSLMLATTQIGVTVCSLLILLIAEPSIHLLLEAPLESLGWEPEVISAVSFGLTLTIVTFLHVLLGEMVPKNISFAIPERAALVLVPLLFGLAIAFKPIVVSLNAMANGVLWLVRVTPKNEANTAYTLDQVEDIVEHSTREGVLLDASGALSNTFEFTEKKVSDVAVAIKDLVIFNESVSPKEIEQAVAKYGFSRYPVKGDDGELIGYLHLKDVIDLPLSEDPVPTKRIRNLISLPASMEIEAALASMRRTQAHMTKTFDAHGVVTGVLFLEDILEELVGEVQDATRRD